MNDTNPNTVTAADHEAGEKIVTVTTRSGRKIRLTLYAPTRRLSRGLAAELARDRDPWTIVKACAPATMDEKFMDRLTPASADLVEVTAFALTFGSDAQKKMEAAALEVTTALGRLAARSSSEGPGSTPTP
jgi:hypothetical protein